MIISVASGKGGTGKTLVATSLALSLKDKYEVQLLDCDVEEPNDHIFLKPVITVREEVFIPVPKIDEEKCTHCGKCAEVCAYHAIAVLPNSVLLFPHLCHGCGACSYFCPENAIIEEGKEIGVIEFGEADGISFIQGKLNVGEAMPVPVIRKVKERVNHEGVTIIDVSPGTSCPVVESIKDSDFCLLVTEPTLSGIHDLERVMEVCRHFNVPAVVCINKYDINENNTHQIEDYCRAQGVDVIARIAFDKVVTEAMVNGLPVVKYSDGKVSRQINLLWQNIVERLTVNKGEHHADIRV